MPVKLRRCGEWLTARRRQWGVPLAMLVLVLLLLGDLVWLPAGQFMGGESGGSDFSFLFLPWWDFILDSLQQGELPLWNPYSSSGMPFIANPQQGLFYPPVWLIGIQPPTRVLGILLVFHLWVAAWGMYLWLRSEAASHWGACFGAVLFAFSGYFLVRSSAGQSVVIMTQAWLPWCLLACHKAMQQKRWTWSVLGGLPIALSLLAGHTASFFFVGVILGVYALYIAWLDNPHTLVDLVKALLPFALMTIVGFAIAAIQLLPTFEFLSFSTRKDAGYTFSSGYSWPPGYVITLLVPNFFGDLINTGYWGDGIYSELIFYVGILPLVLLLIAGTRLRHRLTPWLLVFAGGGLLLALGRFGILHRLAYRFIPLFSATRAPARAGFLFTFAVAALGGLIVSWIERQPTTAIELDAWKVVGAIVGGLAALVILLAFLLFMLQRDANPEVGRLWHVANYTSLFLLFFVLAVVLLLHWRRGCPDGPQGAILAIGLLLLDLWSFGRPLFHAVPVPENQFWKNVAELVDTEDRILPLGLNMFDQNLGMPYQLQSVFSYDPMWIARYTEFTSAAVDHRARAYDLLRARYLAAGEEMNFSDEPGAPRLIGQQDGVWVYERPGVFPPAWLVHQVELQPPDALLSRLNDATFDARSVALMEEMPTCVLGRPSAMEQVSVVSRSNNRISLHVDADAGGILVLSEIAYPGWRATLDGEPLPILQADYILRAVCVPAGEHEIQFTFLPTSLLLGAGITLLTLCIVIWAGIKIVRHT